MYKQFKVGDLVRVVDKLVVVPYGTILEVIIDHENGMITTNDGSHWSYISSLLEPVTHLTTKEFIKLVEDMGYGILIVSSVIEVYDRGSRLFTLYEGCLGYSVSNDIIITNDFDDIMNTVKLYANTPLELREEKEKLYTLELPNNDGENFKYYNYNCEDDNQYYFGDITNDTLYQTQFTKKEIYELPNQELIKALIKKEVKEKENEK